MFCKRAVIALLTSLAFGHFVSSMNAADKDPQPVVLPTADGVELHGRYLPGEKKSPAVIVLDDLGANARPKRCDELAKALAAEGCAVVCFDFRGHGKSVEVGADFWADPNNRKLVRGYVADNPRDTIRHADFQRGYAPFMANDVAAARTFLDERNDVGDCNTRQIIVIGFGSGASIGSFWVASEWTRYRSYGGFPERLAIRPEGRDIVGCVWVDLHLQVDRQVVPVWDWILAAETKRNTLIGWVYRQGDSELEKFGERCEQSLNRPESKLFVKGGVEGSAKQLLSENSRVIPEIIEYVKAIRAKKDLPLWSNKNYFGSRFAFVWPGAQSLLAKDRGEELLQPIPVDRMLKNR